MDESHPDYSEYAWVNFMRSMLGKQVVVTIAYSPLREYSGRLLMFDDAGQVCLEDKSFHRNFMWPNLDTRLADE